MSIHNVDLFKGLMALNEIASAMSVERHEAGSIIYNCEEPADHFYSLIEGKVQLSLGGDSHIDHTVQDAGEIFGWSSMVDRESYTNTAKCEIPTRVNKISKKRLDHIFEKHPHDGIVFYKRLAAAVLQRLIHNYSACRSAENL